MALPAAALEIQILEGELPIQGRIQVSRPDDPVFVVPKGQHLARVVRRVGVGAVVILELALEALQAEVRRLDVLDVSPALIAALALVVETERWHVGPVAEVDDDVRPLLDGEVRDPLHVIVGHVRLGLYVRDDHVDPPETLLNVRRHLFSWPEGLDSVYLSLFEAALKSGALYA